MIGGDVIAITKRSKNRDLALRFARYLMSKEVQKIFVTELGWPPVRNDVSGDVKKWQKPFFRAIFEALQHGYFRPYILGWSAVHKYVNLLQGYCHGGAGCERDTEQICQRAPGGVREVRQK